MTQLAVAQAMARPVSGRRLVQRLERGGVGTATVGSVAEYLRAVQAGFGGLEDVLDSYVSVPIPAAVRQRAAVASRSTIPAPAGRGANELQALPWLDRKQHKAEVARIRKLASYWVLRLVYEHFLHNLLNAAGAPAHHWVRRRSASFGRKVFTTLLRTRGGKLKLRPERLERARKWGGTKVVPVAVMSFVEQATTELFEDMQDKGELDWLPPEEQAREIMAKPRRHRVKTDAEMCLAEWWEAHDRFFKAWLELETKARAAAMGVVEQMVKGPELVRLYLPAVIRAVKIGSDTRRGTPQRQRDAADFLAQERPGRPDKKVLAKLFEAAVAVWDEQRDTLPPWPGPKPV